MLCDKESKILTCEESPKSLSLPGIFRAIYDILEVVSGKDQLSVFGVNLMSILTTASGS